MIVFRGKFKGASLLALGIACTLALSACSSLPFKKKSQEDAAVASQGERLSIVAFEQKLEAAKSLKDVGYYLPPVQPVTSWRTASGPQDALIQNADAAKEFKIAWTKSIGAGSKGTTEVLAQPVSDGRLIYTLDGEARISAFDVNTGSQTWSVDLNPKNKRDKVGFGGGLALSEDGTLYVTSGYRTLTALDSATGKVIWQKAVDTQFHSAPAVDATHIYATDVDNQIFAFDRSTGDMKWTYQAIAEPARLLRTAAPIATGDVVYAPFSSGELVALNSDSGSVKWGQVLAQSTRTNALSEIRDIAGHPAIYSGTIFAASHSGVFQAMNTTTGEPVWTISTDSTNSPWVAGDVVFLTNLQGELLCANRSSGQIYWIKALNSKAAQKSAKKSSGTGIYDMIKNVGTKKGLPQWSGPFMASDRLIMVNSLGQAVALDPKTGDATQTLSLGAAAYIAPIAVGDKVFVVTDDAKLVAIR